MEDLSSCSLLDAVDDISCWNKETIGWVLDDMAVLHAVYFNRADELLPVMNINDAKTIMTPGMRDLLCEMTRFNHERFQHFFSSDLADLFIDFIGSIETHINRMNAYHRTLTHNDFNPRNICLRHHSDGPRIVAYDWEVPCFQNPQHDLAEFLAYTVDEKASFNDFLEFTERYRMKLSEITGSDLPREDFYQILYINALSLGVIRFNLYLLAHNIMHFTFMDRVFGRLAVIILELRKMTEDLMQETCVGRPC